MEFENPTKRTVAMKMSNLKIGTRLYISFGIVLLLLAALAATSWNSLAVLRTEIDVITSENNVKIANANAMRAHMNVIARAVRNIIIYDEPQQVAMQKERIAKATTGYEENYRSLQSLLVTDFARKTLADIEAGRASAMPELNRVTELANMGNRGEAAVLLRTKVQGIQDLWFASIQQMIELQEKQNNDSIKKMHHQYSNAVWFLTIIALSAVALGTFLAWSTTRSVTQPISEAVRVAQSVANNDLTTEIVVARKDETGLLMQELKNMQQSLNTVVSGVRSAADSVATASTQISQGNNDLSQRTEEQASALEETAASMEQLSATVKQNADTAIQANQMAVHASDVAAKGGDVVGRVVRTMADINTSSKKIADIINVIDGIAFQTNILALNAAVEAARAGEQGRGFAVVASEVRSLAGRSAQAAKEIKQLISDSVDRVEQGTALVDTAGKTMTDVVAAIRGVTDLMGEISAASSEQSTGMAQIGEAVGQMDQVTQQNAALVEEMAAAAGSLNVQARDLVNAVAVFKLPASASATSRTLAVL